jgi:GT2 family glycosyltransferase
MLSQCAVIICTKNRPFDLERTLFSLANQSQLPGSLIVVDDSTDNKTRDILDSHPIAALVATSYIHPEHSHAGLPAARNTGIRNLPKETEIVLFLDDDVTLEKEYLHSLCEVFESYSDLSGVSGFITNGYSDRSSPQKIFLAFAGIVNPVLVPSTLFMPRVTHTAEAMGPLFRKSGRSCVPAQWLSGCNMAYRIAIFSEGWHFDEKLVGYALGEDMIFSHSLHIRGKNLALVYTARLVHRSSPIGRLPSRSALVMRLGYRRYALMLFYGKSILEEWRFALFVAEFMTAALLLSILYRKNISYFRETVKAFCEVRPLLTDIKNGSLASLNQIL